LLRRHQPVVAPVVQPGLVAVHPRQFQFLLRRLIPPRRLVVETAAARPVGADAAAPVVAERPLASRFRKRTIAS
jgi:hypothetical protein